MAIHAEDGAEDPHQEREAGYSGDKHHPKPDKQVDLLVKEIDGQHTLYRVSLDVAQPPDFKIAHGDPGEAG